MGTEKNTQEELIKLIINTPFNKWVRCDKPNIFLLTLKSYYIELVEDISLLSDTNNCYVLVYKVDEQEKKIRIKDPRLFIFFHKLLNGFTNNRILEATMLTEALTQLKNL